MAKHADLRNAMQTRLKSITGLRVYDVATGAEMGPCATVYPLPPDSGFFKITSGSCGMAFRFIVEVHVPLSIGLAKAQDTLDGYIDPPNESGSVAYAIAADPTLGGVAQTSIARAFQVYTLSELNKVATLMAQILVEVTA